MRGDLRASRRLAATRGVLWVVALTAAVLGFALAIIAALTWIMT